MQKRFEEYFAKVVLESCFPKRFTDLQISDKPDLRSGNKIGIEVTNCMPTRVAEAFNLWYRVAKQGEQTPLNILKRLEQLDEVRHEGNELIWYQSAYTDNIDESPIKDFFNAVEKKVNRLNSKNAGYADMVSYELFVNSAITIPFHQIGMVMQRLQELNNTPKRFETIYFVDCGRKLYAFDMVKNTLQEIYFAYDAIGQIAYGIYKETTNE